MTAPSLPNLVSIVMPAHNSATTIADSVASVIAQTYDSWELLVINDASTDDTLAIVKGLAAKDPRIKIISLESNGGVANARNVGIAHAQGRYVAFLDSDDRWLPKKLEAQIQFMRQEQAAFSFTSYRMLSGDGSEGALITAPARVTYTELLKGNVIGCLTVIIDGTAIPSPTMPNIKHEDFACWLQILKTGIVARGLPQELALYRRSVTSVSGDKQRSAAWTWHILRRVEGLSLIRSLWCFSHYIFKSIHKHVLPSHPLSRLMGTR